MLSDTHVEAEKVWIEMLRRATPTERFAKMLSLTATTISLSRRAVAEANCDLSPEELNLKCVELFYGKELAERLGAYLKSR